MARASETRFSNARRIACILILLAGCGQSPSILTSYEATLEVDGPTERQFHSTLYYPKGLALQYPGYLLGLEKAPQAVIHGPAQGGVEFLSDEPKYFAQEKGTAWGLGSLPLLRKLRTDSKAMFVSHIARYGFEEEPATQQSGEVKRPYRYLDSCYLYNAFQSPYFARLQGGDGNNSGRWWRDIAAVMAWRSCPGAIAWDGPGAVSEDKLFANGAVAVRALAAAIAKDLKNDDYTHVIVFVMGWNTAQDEAIRDFNDLTGNLFQAAREARELAANRAGGSAAPMPFRPLIVCVSWPSFWSKSIFNPLSYVNKANDADEVGLLWLNLLLNKELPAAMSAIGSKAPVVLIGHSFGARAVLRAVSSSPALSTKADDATSGGLYTGVNLVIGLQGAVSINRFLPANAKESSSYEGAPLRDYRLLRQTRFVLTASSHDSAAGGPIFWYDPAGSVKSYNLSCEGGATWHSSVFQCFTAHEQSGRNAPGAKGAPGAGFQVREKATGSSWRFGERIAVQKDKVLYIDTSDGITEFSTLGTGGNAHSDIYRLPMGRLIWTLIASL